MNASGILQSIFYVSGDYPLLGRLLLVSGELILLALLVWLLIRFLPVRAPRIRALLWLLVLAKPILGLGVGTLLPLVQFSPPAAVESVLTGDTGPVNPDSLVARRLEERRALAALESRPPSTSGGEEVTRTAGVSSTGTHSVGAGAGRSIPVGGVLLGLWVAGVIGLAGLAVVDRVRIHKLLRSTCAPPGKLARRFRTLANEMKLKRIPRLRVARTLDSPALVAVFRPVVLLPWSLANESDTEQLDWLLRHELMHHRLHDPTGLVIRRLAEILFFFHPVVWWAGRKWEEAMELACDRALLQSETDAHSYARELYRVLENQHRRPGLPLGAGLFATRTQIGRRIEALLSDPLRSRARLTAFSVFGLMLVGLIGLTVGIGFSQDSGEAPTEASESVSVADADHPDRPGVIAVPPEEEPEAVEAEDEMTPEERSAGELNLERLEIPVRDTAGNPASNVEVCLVQSTVEGEALFGPVETDEQGIAVFPDVPSYEWYSLTAVARVPGESIGVMLYNSSFVERPLEVLLVPSTTVSGKVSVPEGYDLSKVTVRVTTCNVPDPGSPSSRSSIGIDQMKIIPWKYQTAVDSDGRFALPGLPEEGYVYLAAEAPGLGQAQAMTDDPPTAQLRMSMLPEGVIEGTVTDATGQPVAGQKIMALPHRVGGLAVRLPYESTSDDSGRFVINGLRDNGYIVEAELNEDSGDWTVAPVMNVVVKPGERISDVNLRMERGAVVQGTVRDSKSGKPLAGAYVVALREGIDDAGLGGARTDSRGEYRIRVPAGEVRLYISGRPEGYTYPKDPDGIRAPTRFHGHHTEIKAGETLKTGLDFVLDPAGEKEETKYTWAEGTVLDVDGNPLDQAVIRHCLKRPDGTQVSGEILGKTGVDGRYRVRVVVSCENGIIAGGGKYGVASSRTFTPRDGEVYQVEDLEVLHASSFLGGKVIDPEGHPVANAGVSVSSRHNADPWDLKTDAEGKFFIEHVVPEPVHIYVIKVGFRGGRNASWRDIAPGRTDHVFTLIPETQQHEGRGTAPGPHVAEAGDTNPPPVIVVPPEEKPEPVEGEDEMTPEEREEFQNTIKQIKTDLRNLHINFETYFIDHADYPEALWQLTTPIAYTWAVPEDPFAAFVPRGTSVAGATEAERRRLPLKMRFAPDYSEVRLYSIGPDRIDQSGSVVYNPDDGPEGSGDIVRTIELARYYRFEDPAMQGKVEEQMARLDSLRSAVNAWFVEHRDVPDTLEALADPLPHLVGFFEDSFAGEGDVSYRVDREKGVLRIWSVGPDGDDDGGEKRVQGRFARGQVADGDLVVELELEGLPGGSPEKSDADLLLRDRPSQRALYEMLVEIKEKEGRDNAMLHYILADGYMSELPSGRQDTLIKEVLSDGWSEKADELLPLIAAYQPMFREIRKGVAVDYARNIGGEQGPASPIPNYLAGQVSAKMLCVEGRHFESQGKYEEALDNYLAVLTMGRDYGSPDSVLIGHLISLAIRNIAFQQINRLASSGNLGEKSLEKALSKLKHIETTGNPIANALREEEKTFRWIIRDASKNPENYTEFFGPEVKDWTDALDQIEADHRDAWEFSIRYAETPEWEWRADDFNRELKKKREKYHRSVEIAIPNFAEAKTRYLVTQAKSLETQQAVALAAYKLKHGEYPESLDGLVPKYFESIPVDPFSGESFRYETTGEEFRLWSVGPDGKDDRNQEHPNGSLAYDPTNGSTSDGDLFFR